jgi:anti-sigma factor RsiW
MSQACAELRAELVAFLDEELAPEARARVEAHLADCAACRAELERLWKALGALDALPATQPGPGFEARLEAALARERKPAWWARWLRPAPALALGGALAAALLLVVLVQGTAPPAGPRLLPADELAVAERLELFADLEALEQLELLEDLEAIESLEEEG